jgi:hypothetical protein
MMRRLPLAAGILSVLACNANVPGQRSPVPDSSGPNPQQLVNALLEADRAYSAASAKTDLVTGLRAMFARDVAMPTPARKFAQGLSEVTEALRANPANAKSRIEWTPIRGGISADALHGFTYGYMSLHNPDGTVSPLKYLAYWVREDGAWKVAAYKRFRRPPGEVSMALIPASLPTRLVAPTTDSTVIAGHARTLAAAEQAFSDESAVIGVGPAFAKWGSADAMNMGRLAAFTFSAAEIGRDIGGANPSEPGTIAWKSDRVIVSSSGDLGVSFGMIRQRADANDPGQPFFTIWRRASPSDPWRYIAE